jgi:dihydroneopterin aldolase
MNDNIKTFVDQIIAGENADAKETVENILSQKSFEALEARKKEIASGIFKDSDSTEEVTDETQLEVQETE